MYFRKDLATFFVIITLLVCTSWKSNQHATSQNKASIWVDSVFASMNLDQKIGQLFMISAYSNKDEVHYNTIDTLIEKYHLGGLIFMQGGPLRQAKLTNRYQQKARVPLFISIDGEWGLSMRLDSTLPFPKQMTLGALKNDSLIYAMGKEIGAQCKRMGVHINFAPVVDVNSNPNNPVIGYRAFGEQKKRVAEKGIAYARGMQSQGVLACAKHFPGHGDTEVDSHLGLPVLKHKKGRLDDIELYPFKMLIEDSIPSVMVGHLHIPAYDDRQNMPSTLSDYTINKLLKDKLGFSGLIFTDALNMKGVSEKFKPGEIEVLALQAGNDVLLFAENVPIAVSSIKSALESGTLLEDSINASVKKILFYKYKAGLNAIKPVDLNNLVKEINTNSADLVKENIYLNAITLVANKQKLLPLVNYDSTKIAALHFGADTNNNFSNTLSKYAKIDHFFIGNKSLADSAYQNLYQKLEHYSLVIASFQGMTNQINRNFKLNTDHLTIYSRLQARLPVVTVIFGNAYALRNFTSSSTIICTYEDNVYTKSLAAQMIFGVITPKGKLPVNASNVHKIGVGDTFRQVAKLQYTSVPERAGFDRNKLAKIDTLVSKAIASHAMPGCQILVAKDGLVLYNKQFGHLRYDSAQKVNEHTLYDVASITKVASTLQAIMFLQSQQMIHVDSMVNSYLPEARNTNKGNIIIKEMLAHQAGLQAFLEHYRKTIDHKEIRDFYYAKSKDSVYTFAISDSLWARNDLPDSVWTWTLQSSLSHKKDSCYHYKYSDVGFYIAQKIAERKLELSLDSFCAELYHSLNMYSSLFNPLRRFKKDNIAPTEIDHYFRPGEVCGIVHDPGAAMYGGVAGHAGLFSTSNDLAKLFYMNMQDGEYGLKRYFKKGTISFFRSRHYIDNRRGLGWDKPEWAGGGPTSHYASQKTFGHTGFTGNCVWIDPKYNLMYIFLSNRTYPSAENKKLITQNIRTKIHDLIYEAMTPITGQ